MMTVTQPSESDCFPRGAVESSTLCKCSLREGLRLLKVETIFSSKMGYDCREFRFSTTVNHGMITLSDPDKVVAYCVTTGEARELPIATQANIVATESRVIYFPNNPWSTIRIVALNDPQTILGEAAHETAVIWLLWTADQTAIVYCLANCDVYRWEQTSSLPELVLTPMSEIQQARTSLQVHVSEDERWWAMIGASIDDEREPPNDGEPGIAEISAEGYVQCYDALTGGSRIYQGLSCTIARTTIGNKPMDLLVIANNVPGNKMSLRILQPDKHCPVPPFEPVLVEIPGLRRNK
ncbi:hypothetical protein FRC03_006432 [Tulasnella sp. 419]|nr:hypothetical protein FRC03_006432 [Tulasnella sp. 419]